MANQHELLCAAIQTQLESITAGTDGYAYTPDAVLRTSFFGADWTPDPTFQTVYYLRPETETKRFGPESCRSTSLLSMAVVACRRLVNPTENPSAGVAPERWQVANELFADVCQAIFTDPTFGGQGRRLFETQVSADYQIYIDGWAVVEVRFVVQYTTNRPGR